MRNLKARFELILKPFDLTLATTLKLISDWHALLKHLSPLASITFILFNFKRLFVSWKPFITLALLIPALIIAPSSEIMRFMLSICILWIFLDKLNDPEKKYSVIAGGFVILYVFVITLGILNPSFYLEMGDRTMRYKFILESHNALALPALISLIYLMNVFLTLEESSKHRLLKWASYVSILLLFIVFLFIKSRIYILLSFLFILFIAIKKFRSSRALMMAPLLYLIFFFAITLAGTQLSPDNMPDQADGTGNGWAYANNDRLLSTSGTGRMKLIHTFIDTYQEKGWRNFLYQNNVDAYYKKKAAIPGINLKVSTLTESSYLVITLYAGFLGLLVFLFIFAHYLWRFFMRREFLSLLFMALLLATWFFEETIIFPFGLLTHLFALATINRLEMKKI